MARALPWGAGHGHGVPMGCMAWLLWPQGPHGVHGTVVMSPWGAWHSQSVPKAPQGQGAAEGHEGVRGRVPAGTCTPGISTQITWPGSGSAALLRGRGTQGHRDAGDAGGSRSRRAARHSPGAAARWPQAALQPCGTTATAGATHTAPGCCFALRQTRPRKMGLGTWGRGDVGTPCRCCPFSPRTAQRRARHRPGGCSTHFPQHGSLAKKIADSGQPESLVGQK